MSNDCWTPSSRRCRSPHAPPVASQWAPPCAISSRTTSSSRRVRSSNKPRSHRQRRPSSPTTRPTSCSADSSATERSRWDSLGTTQQLPRVPHRPISSSRPPVAISPLPPPPPPIPPVTDVHRLQLPPPTLPLMWLPIAKSTRRKRRAITEDITTPIPITRHRNIHHPLLLLLTRPW